MIVRLWEADVPTERAEEFCNLVASAILPKMLAVDGCLSGETLLPIWTDTDEVRVVGITRWRDEESLRGFLGPMWRVRPMWEEKELEYLASVPRVSHFEPVEAP